MSLLSMKSERIAWICWCLREGEVPRLLGGRLTQGVDCDRQYFGILGLGFKLGTEPSSRDELCLDLPECFPFCAPHYLPVPLCPTFACFSAAYLLLLLAAILIVSLRNPSSWSQRGFCGGNAFRAVDVRGVVVAACAGQELREEKSELRKDVRGALGAWCCLWNAVVLTLKKLCFFRFGSIVPRQLADSAELIITAELVPFLKGLLFASSSFDLSPWYLSKLLFYKMDFLSAAYSISPLLPATSATSTLCLLCKLTTFFCKVIPLFFGFGFKLLDAVAFW